MSFFDKLRAMPSSRKMQLLNAIGLIGSKTQRSADNYRIGMFDAVRQREAERLAEEERARNEERRGLELDFLRSQIGLNEAKAAGEGGPTQPFAGNSFNASLGNLMTELAAKIQRGEPLSLRDQAIYQYGKAQLGKQQTITDAQGRTIVMEPIDTSFLPPLTLDNAPRVPMLDAGAGVPSLQSQPAVTQPQTGPRVVAEPKSSEEVRREENQRKIDQNFVSSHNEWKTGGFTKVTKNLEQLRGSLNSLTSGETTTGGTSAKVIDIFGDLGEKAINYIDPNFINTRDQVQEVVQQSLKLILGGQFGEKEGQQLIARAYNQSLPTEVNAMRVRRLMQQIQDAAVAMNEASQYFDRNQTLEGFKGRVYDKQDFLNIDYSDLGGITEETGGDVDAELKALREELGLAQ